jgi:3-dehydroquinate synthase
MQEPVAPQEGTAAARTVRVSLGGRSYDVLIGPGLVAAAGRLLAERFGQARTAIVSDAHVAAAGHLAALEASLAAAGSVRGRHILSPGEAAKSFASLAALTEALLGLGVERSDFLVALGGGVVGDLAGFAASMLRRGVRYVQVPSTLLAQVDSSVGGKTGINTSQGKNLVGAFHQPSLVLADIELLRTLPAREMRAGYAEVAKHALLGDAGFYRWLEDNWRSVLGHDPAAVTHAVLRSVEMKAGIVARDEAETGERMLLNLGHTFGHALEAWTGYSDRLLHGEGVAIGLCLAFRLSERLGACPPQTAARVAAHLKAAGLPNCIGDIPGGETADAGELVRLMGQDKKVRDGRPTFILAREIGQAFVTRDVTADEARAFLAGEIGARSA